MRKRKAKLFVTMGLILSLVISSFAPTVSAANNPSNLDLIGEDLYLNQASETVLIEGISYTYEYSYEGDNRTIHITNNEENTVEKVSYNEDDSTVYLNDDIAVATIGDSDTGTDAPISALSSWKSVDKDYVYISWLRGTATATVAAVISSGLGFLSGATVIGVMGAAAISTLAAAATGGTLTIDLQRMTVFLQPPIHRYVWSFRASTGDNYDPYIYMVN